MIGCVGGVADSIGSSHKTLSKAGRTKNKIDHLTIRFFVVRDLLVRFDFVAKTLQLSAGCTTPNRFERGTFKCVVKVSTNQEL